MKTKIAMYLAGSIKKGHEKSDESYWTEEDMQVLRKALSLYEVSFLNPAFRTDDLSDQRSVFGRDMTQVFCSNVVFVDARDRRGLGVGAEMMWAKLNKIPVVTWAPKDTHYHKSQTTILNVPVKNFIHPFVLALSDHLAENLTEGAKWIQKMMKEPSIEIKGIESIRSAMQYYKDKQFEHDQPMKELFLLNEELKKKIQRLQVVQTSSK